MLPVNTWMQPSQSCKWKIRYTCMLLVLDSGLMARSLILKRKYSFACVHQKYSQILDTRCWTRRRYSKCNNCETCNVQDAEAACAAIKADCEVFEDKNRILHAEVSCSIKIFKEILLIFGLFNFVVVIEDWCWPFCHWNVILETVSIAEPLQNRRHAQNP